MPKDKSIVPPGVVGSEEAKISTEAQDLEDMFGAEENDHAGSLDEINKEKQEPISVDTDSQGNASDPSQQGAVNEMKDAIQKGKEEAIKEVARVAKKEEAKKRERVSAQKKDNNSEDDVFAAMMKQPFSIVMENLEVTETDFHNACRSLFVKGYYTEEINILGFKVVLRSKNMNNHVDFAEYMRRILITQISQREFETLRQLRQMAYAIVSYGGEDWSELSIADKFEKLLDKDEMILTMIINSSTHFWRISHLMMHPGALSFLERLPQT